MAYFKTTQLLLVDDKKKDIIDIFLFIESFLTEDIIIFSKKSFFKNVA